MRSARISIIAAALVGCGPTKEEVAALEAKVEAAEAERWNAGPDDRGRAIDEMLANQYISEATFVVGERITVTTTGSITAIDPEAPGRMRQIALDWEYLAKFSCETLRKYHAVSARTVEVVVVGDDVDRAQIVCPHHSAEWKD